LEGAGKAYLREAREHYLRWGAGAKVALLDEQFPGIDRLVIHARPTTIEASVEQLDLSAVVKVSQTLSSEIVASRLIERLMVIAVEHAAAERALLILLRGDERRLEAMAVSTDGEVKVQPSCTRSSNPGDRECMQAALDAHFTGRSPYDHEVWFIMASGEVRWFRARGPRVVVA
jgi:hypothetical protein